jgi:hypothetical protein
MSSELATAVHFFWSWPPGDTNLRSRISSHASKLPESCLNAMRGPQERWPARSPHPADLSYFSVGASDLQLGRAVLQLHALIYVNRLL